MQKFEGLIAAPFTPMTHKGEIMYEQIQGYAEFLLKNKITGAFINGSTGESASLSGSERMKVAENWTAAAKGGPLKVINLIGGTSYNECMEHALHAETCGVDAIAIVAPYYFKPAGAKQLAEYCAVIAEKVPQLPVYFYHIPVLTGCHIPMYDFLQEAAPLIPNLAGIKFTHEDFMDFLSCLRFKEGKYEILGGRDENLLSALVLGCRGAVGSTFNYAAPLYYAMIQAFDRGDLETARELQQKAINMIRLLGKYGGIASGKAYMKYIGFDFGGFRLPIKDFDSSMYGAFVSDVKALGMEEWFSKYV